jgi:hypothetical protein
MESIILTVKFALFLAMEVFVVATLVGALIAGLYQIVRDRVSESRRPDEVAPKALPTTPISS